MKYYKWKLKWEMNPVTGTLEGKDPTALINTDSVRIEPQFCIGNDVDPSAEFYCYLLKGELNLSSLTDWFIEEITAQQMLEAAQSASPNAYLEDGFIKYPIVDDSL